MHPPPERTIATLHEIANVLGSTLEPDALFAGIVDCLRATVPFERCAIARHDPDSGRHTYWYESSNPDVRRLTVDTDSRWEAAEVYRTHEPYYEPDITQHRGGTRERLIDAGFHSTLVIPILCAGECVAHISMSTRSKSGFAEKDIALLAATSPLIGPAIHSAMLYQESRDHAARLALAGEIARAVSSTLEPGLVFEVIVSEIRKAMGFDRCAIAHWEAETGQVQYWRVESDIEVAELVEQHHRDWEGRVVYQTGEHLYVPDIESTTTEMRGRLHRAGLRCVLVVPIKREGCAFGHISLSSTHADAYSPADIELLRVVADHVASAIRNAMLYEDVQRNRQFYQNVIDHSGDPIVIVDESRAVTRWNDAARALFGHSEAEVLERDIGDLLSDGAVAHWRRTAAAPEAEDALRFEAECVRRDGTRVPTEVTVSPVRNAEGRIESSCIIFKDLTERRRIEAERQARAARLEELVRERTRELEAAQVELLHSERLATLGQLTGVVSHELRNPLGTIHNCLQSITVRAGGEAPELVRIAEMADRNVQRCVNVISELLDHLRIDVRRLEPGPLGPWLEAMLDEYLTKCAVPVERRIEASGEAEFDTERLRRAVFNLLDNAVQATTAAAGSNGAAVRVTLESTATEFVLSVEDQGVGIAQDNLERVFEPMFSTKSMGTGLGLYIVREIVSQHGGRISLDSVQGRGTRAEIRLPCGQAAAG